MTIEEAIEIIEKRTICKQTSCDVYTDCELCDNFCSDEDYNMAIEISRRKVRNE